VFHTLLLSFYRKYTECAGQHIPVLAAMVSLLGDIVDEPTIVQALATNSIASKANSQV
jgi:hypothetical protein